jgi:hypothetical protein
MTDSTSDSTTDSTADSTTDIIMSGTQTPASSVNSDTLLNIDPRLLTDQVEVENEEARLITCLAVCTETVPLSGPVGAQTTDTVLKDQ